MIPSYFPTRTPPGEQALHKALAESDATDDWIVLHSLAIAEHVKKPEGEADFIVIVPDLGVLVIEVKSHLTVDYRDGLWKLGNDAPTARGPFKQANDAMHSLRKYLLKKKVNLRSIPVLSAAWFTAVRARTMLPESPEWHDWQVLDSEDLKNGVAAAVLRTIKAGTAHLDKTTHVSYGGVGPDAATAHGSRSCCGPSSRWGWSPVISARPPGPARPLRRGAIRGPRLHGRQPCGALHRARRVRQDSPGHGGGTA